VVNHWTKYAIPLVFLAFIFLCSHIPALAEGYMRVCYPVIAIVLSFFHRRIPFSLLDILIIVAIILFLGSIVMMCLRRLSFRRWIQLFLLFGLWLAVWFYMAWGIGYFRPGFHERFAVEPPKEDREFFEAFVEQYIDSLNRAYIDIPYTDHSPLLWRWVGGEADIDNDIEALYAIHYETLRFPYPCGWRRAKKTLIEPLMTRMGVSGYFDPFFNEVHVNNYVLPITYPYTLAHEKAHQFGIANEAECNLYATVICTSSNHPLVRYSGYLQTVSYLLGNLRKISPDRYREITGQIDPRIMADYRAIREHWQKVLNPTLSTVQNKVYDTYLKTNKQQSGILSYSEMTGLLVAWEMRKQKLNTKE